MHLMHIPAEPLCLTLLTDHDAEGGWRGDSDWLKVPIYPSICACNLIGQMTLTLICIQPNATSSAHRHSNSVRQGSHIPYAADEGEPDHDAPSTTSSDCRPEPSACRRIDPALGTLGEAMGAELLGFSSSSSSSSGT